MKKEEPTSVSEEAQNTNTHDEIDMDEYATRPVDNPIDDLQETQDVSSDIPTEVEQDDDSEDTIESETITDDDMVALLKQESDKNLAGWQRTLAEFQNYKRRVEREKMDSFKRITLDTITKILPIIDDFERACANVPEDLKDNPWVSGTILIQSKFQKLLEDSNIEIVDPIGEEFDPNTMEAIGMEDNPDFESGHVTVTLQKGYRSGERTLRPALVRVAN